MLDGSALGFRVRLSERLVLGGHSRPRPLLSSPLKKLKYKSSQHNGFVNGFAIHSQSRKAELPTISCVMLWNLLELHARTLKRPKVWKVSYCSRRQCCLT